MQRPYCAIQIPPIILNDVPCKQSLGQFLCKDPPLPINQPFKSISIKIRGNQSRVEKKLSVQSCLPISDRPGGTSFYYLLKSILKRSYNQYQSERLLRLMQCRQSCAASNQYHKKADSIKDKKGFEGLHATSR